MAQSGLHIPVDRRVAHPVFKSLFADIGDEQSISASLSTFSAHITNIVSMDRTLALPALVLVDEIGAARIPSRVRARHRDHRSLPQARGASHRDDALRFAKSYASTTEGVESAAFGFKAETFAPTYRLLYGSPGEASP
jgi:DNA mismatch repair protein MutS2